ncbi:MAG: hypothetical protein Fur0020_14180 [Thermodesulfovibrionia bacterium]
MKDPCYRRCGLYRSHVVKALGEQGYEDLTFEIKSFEHVPEESPLRNKFRKLHGINATLNLLLLADGIILIMISSNLKR